MMGGGLGISITEAKGMTLPQAVFFLRRDSQKKLTAAEAAVIAERYGDTGEDLARKRLEEAKRRTRGS